MQWTLSLLPFISMIHPVFNAKTFPKYRGALCILYPIVWWIADDQRLCGELTNPPQGRSGLFLGGLFQQLWQAQGGAGAALQVELQNDGGRRVGCGGSGWLSLKFRHGFFPYYR
jgi:hypothetical protein